MKTSDSILVLAAGSLGDCLVTLPALQTLEAMGSVTVAGTLPYQLLGANTLGVSRVVQLDEVLQTGQTPGSYGEAFLFFKTGWEAATLHWKSDDTPLRAPRFMFDDFLCRPRPAHLYWNGVVEAVHPGRTFPQKPMLKNLEFLRSAGKKFLDAHSLASPLVLHPGSGGRTKNPPLELFKNMAEAAVHAGRKVLVVWGEAEVQRLQEIQGAFQGVPGVQILEEPLSLGDLASVLACASQYAGCDSGVSHLAGACGVPSFVLFGPSDPQVWAPPGAHVYCADHGFRDVEDALAAFVRWTAAPISKGNRS
jgi:ADP-heptose:LPS heptosyltransferase